MNIYLMVIPTKSGRRYVGNTAIGLASTLHPSNARRLDLNQALPAGVGELLDLYGSAEFILVTKARCLHSRCDCVWTDEKPKVRK